MPLSEHGQRSGPPCSEVLGGLSQPWAPMGNTQLWSPLWSPPTQRLLVFQLWGSSSHTQSSRAGRMEGACSRALLPKHSLGSGGNKRGRDNVGKSSSSSCCCQRLPSHTTHRAGSSRLLFQPRAGPRWMPGRGGMGSWHCHRKRFSRDRGSRGCGFAGSGRPLLPAPRSGSPRLNEGELGLTAAHCELPPSPEARRARQSDTPSAHQPPGSSTGLHPAGIVPHFQSPHPSPGACPGLAWLSAAQRDSYTSGEFTGGSSALTGGSTGFCSSSCREKAGMTTAKHGAAQRPDTGPCLESSPPRSRVLGLGVERAPHQGEICAATSWDSHRLCSSSPPPLLVPSPPAQTHLYFFS